MDSQLQEIRDKIQNAEMVLVGLGEGFQYGWGALVQDDRYREIEREIGTRNVTSGLCLFCRK